MPTRAEHRATTLRQLSDAAVDVFEQRGADATVDEIAAAAGVSRRTVFRWVGSKEELAFIHPLLWFDVFDAATVRLAQEPMPERMRLSGRAIARFIDDDPEPARRAFLMTLAHPDLAVGFTTVFGRWVDRVSAEALVGIDEPSEDDRFRSRIIGSAVMGVIDAVTREWVVAGEGADFTPIYDRAFAMVMPLLEA